MSALKDKLTALVDALKAEGHHLAQLAEDALAHLKGDEKQLQAEAVADGVQLAKDAEQAAAPVVAEAEHDAAKLGTEAIQAVEKDVTPPASA
jgi:hypothetical protein